MPINYVPHTGISRVYDFHQVAVVYCPSILGNRLGHLSQDSSRCWVLRDFITGRMIRATDSPNGPASTSQRLLEEIEAEVLYSETPPYFSIENVNEWKTYLKLRSMAVLSRPLDEEAQPNPSFGDWQVINEANPLPD